ncbi:RNA-splicing ligase RtcB [Desulfovibrio sp. An276]|uniref:RtcB family protein n=1 Tax=Desulfovibrio sp. An276 TaxID=1965618 RepID=UPI000B3653AF|nr:RtcB family protein [Desulfovibrio sp. An276]OUO52012.1 RNA-splicing ligase RtcB [Desulfovibrio sp. An276]
MIEITGKYSTAKIFTDEVDGESIKQVQLLCNQEFTEGSRIRLMPDIHAGKGCTIGTTMTITDKVVPNLVGVDIGCGMFVVNLGAVDLDFEKLDQVIRKYVPAGFSIHDHVPCPEVQDMLDGLVCKDHVDMDRAAKSVGTLGGGNHFIEIDKDEEGSLYLVVHSGSRHLGLQIANYYQQLAIEQCSAKVPQELAYLTDSAFTTYLNDMRVAQEYAVLNRETIVRSILFNMFGMEALPTNNFTTIHNYIDMKNMILRKGAVSAQKDELFLVPINMRDGSLICRGKGNADWNYSAPHGAGRIMSRSQAKKKLSMAEFQREMAGVYSTSVKQTTLDESPMAYKGMDNILANIGPTADVVKVIKPVYSFKAG